MRDKLHYLFLNVGHFLDHLFMLVFATVAALALGREWGMSYGELIPYATPGFIAFGAPGASFNTRTRPRHPGTIPNARLGRAVLGGIDSLPPAGVLMVPPGISSELWRPACATWLMVMP